MTAFLLGQLVMTPGAESEFDLETRAACLQRHAACDWGDLDPWDSHSNDIGVEKDGRLMSVYNIGDKSLWIITEGVDPNRVTTLLLPSEY